MTLVQRSMPLQVQTEAGEDNKKFKILFSTGEKVLRKWGDSFVHEELDMSRDAIDLSDFNSGSAPIVLDHDTRSVKNIVGVIEKESAFLDGNDGWCVGRFGTDSESDLIRQKVQDRIVNKVSIGYRVLRYEKIPSKDSEYNTIIARKWKPHELSLVVFPADSKAGIRSENTQDYKEIFNLTHESTAQNETPVLEKRSHLDEDLIRKDESKKMIRRMKEIQELVKRANLDNSFAESLIETDKNMDQVRAELFEKLAERSNQIPHKPYAVSVNPVESAMQRNDAMAEAILHRFEQNKKIELTESSRRFAHYSIHDMARSIITQSSSQSFYSDPLPTYELMARALSTSDFPILLANIVGKKLRREYETAARTYDPIVRVTEVNDFKPVTIVQMGDAPVLLKKPEHGSYQSGHFSEQKEEYFVEEFGRMIDITRKMLINDDMSALMRLPAMFGRRAAELESDVAWDAILKNPLMGDGKNLFCAEHGNYTKTGSGGIFDVNTIAAAKKAMRTQKGLDGGRINLTPKYLIIPAALEAEALKFLTTTTPAKDSDVNPYKSSLTLIVEPRLDDISTTGWYLATDIGMIDLIEMAYLKGQRGLYLESDVDFSTDGVRLKCRMDVGAKAIDWRGFYKNEGK